jgi:hypothetical protein
LNNCGSNDQPLKRKLFGTTPNLDMFNTKTLLTRQPIIAATVMNVNPFMVVVPTNVLCIQLLKYHDNDDLVIHIRQLTKVCVTNGEDTNNHKLQYFPNFNYLRGKVVNWFAKYKMTHPVATWDEIQQDFVNRFSEIRSKGQTTITLKYAQQKKYEFVEITMIDSCDSVWLFHNHCMTFI